MGVVATLLVVLSVTSGTVFGLSQWLEAQRQREEARGEQLATSLIGGVLNFALKSDGGPDRPMLSIAEHLERSAGLIEQRYGHDPKFAARFLIQLSDSLHNAPMAKRLDLLQRAHEIGRKANDPAVMTYALCNLARRHVMTGNAPQALERMQQARRHLAHLQPADSLRVECLLAEGMVEGSRANRARAIPLVREAADMLDRKGVGSREAYASALSYLAGLYMDDSNFTAAIDVTERSVQLMVDQGVADGAEQLTLLQNLAVMLFATGEVRNSLVERERLNQMSRKFYTADTMPLSLIFNHVQLLLRMERSTEALSLLDGHLQRARSAGQPRTLVDFLQAKAHAHVQLSEWGSAERALAEAGPLMDQGVGPPYVKSSSETRWAEIALSRNDAAGVRKHIDAALSLSGYGTDKPERTLKRVLLTAAQLALAMNQRADAEKFATDALRIGERDARRADSSADVGHALLLLAKSRANIEPPAKLRSMLERAVQCLNNGLYPEHRLTVEARRMLETI